MAENRKVFRVKDTAGTTEQVFFETKADQTLIDTIDGLTATEVQSALAEIYAQAKKGAVTSVNGKTGAVTIVKADVGLGNVDNTSDANKPVSKAQQTALNKKVDKTITVNGHALSANVTVTKGDVGLGNVTNDAQVKRSEMGKASGVATLGTDGKVPSSQLPSYVDDVLEFTNKAGFPTTGAPLFLQVILPRTTWSPEKVFPPVSFAYPCKLFSIPLTFWVRLAILSAFAFPLSPA